MQELDPELWDFHVGLRRVAGLRLDLRAGVHGRAGSVGSWLGDLLDVGDGRDLLYQRAVPRLGLTELGLRPLALGDVADDRYGLEAPVFCLECFEGDFDVHPPPFFLRKTVSKRVSTLRPLR